MHLYKVNIKLQLVMIEKKKKSVFLNGAISPGFIADSIAAHSKKTTIGAHDIFLGQVRADFINGSFNSPASSSASLEPSINKPALSGCNLRLSNPDSIAISAVKSAGSNL